jgi:hypothetical protein
MTWLEWTVLIAASLWALLTNIQVRNAYKESTTPAIAANLIALVQMLSVVGVLVLHRTPYHLLWLFPLGYFLAFFAYHFKPLTWLAWLYGYVLACTILARWYKRDDN